MAQEPETEKNASGIAHAAKRKWGYDAEQVDAFLERAHMLYEGEGAQLTQHDIQNVSFELVKGGYVIAQVDAPVARTAGRGGLPRKRPVQIICPLRPPASRRQIFLPAPT